MKRGCGIFAVGVLVVVLVIAYISTESLAPKEIIRRTADARPTWTSYDEDLKGQIGATPLAQWEGAPLQARQEDHAIEFQFALASPWREWQSSPPILLRDPQGIVHQNDRVVVSDSQASYIFQLPEATPERLPWVQLRYPGGERRIMFDKEGRWQADTLPRGR